MKLRISNLIFLYFAIAFVGISGFFFTIFLPKPVGFYAFVLAAAIGGFSVAANIYYTKKGHRQLVCPAGSNCNVVVNSRYSKFFGVSLEYWGMLYFTIIIVSYTALIFAPGVLSGFTLAALMLLTAGAGMFSSYLLFVQAFLLRAWCIWCILAAFLSLTVFTMSLISLPIAATFFADIDNIILMVKFFGFALGIGGSTSAVFLFFRFLKDLDIDDKELEIMKGISELVWFGFGLVLVSQFLYYIAYAEALVHSGVFIAQTISLFVTAFSGAILMIIYAPFLVFVPFKKLEEKEKEDSYKKLRRSTVSAGSIALASWYFAFVMSFIADTRLTILLLVYAATLILAVALGLIWERELIEKGDRKQEGEAEFESENH